MTVSQIPVLRDARSLWWLRRHFVTVDRLSKELGVWKGRDLTILKF